MTKIILPPERRVGHLTVLRQGEREISPTEYATLTLREQLAIIRNAQGKQKYDLLLNSQKAERLVPLLHPQELYLTVNLLGATDSLELLALSSPEQITLLLDLDCWDGDVLSPVLSLRWLELLAQCGEEKLCQLVRQIEPEVLALFLKKHLTIIRGIEAYDDDDADNARRLESIYDIDYHSEDAAKIIGSMLKLWQDREQESYLLLMEMIRSENLTALEEEIYQARNNRLSDLGIIPHQDARGIYSYIDPESFTPGGKSNFALEAEELQNPLALLVQAQPEHLLADILAAGIDHETACELMHLSNRKMSADRADLASPQDVAQTVQGIYDTLNLALEYLAGNDFGKAEQIVHSTYLLHLFQLGHSLVKKRQARAETLAKCPIYPFVDYPELLFIDSLLEQPPLFYRAPGAETPSQLQKLTSIKDLELVDRRLTQIEALELLFTTALPFTLPDPADEEAQQLTLSGIFMTAVAQRVLGEPFAAMPLKKNRLAELAAMTVADNSKWESFARNLHATVAELDPQCLFFCEFCLELWQDFFSDADGLEQVEAAECFLWLE